MTKLYANIAPHLPEAVRIDSQKARELTTGISVALYVDYPLETSFSESRYLMKKLKRSEAERTILHGQTRQRIVPSLWMLAHAYLESDRMRDFLNFNLVSTSSARRVVNDTVHVSHQVDEDAKDGVDIDNYGMVIPVPLKDYPADDMQLAKLIEDYPNAAQALFLMDRDQLMRFSSRLPKDKYDPARPACQGVGFIDPRTAVSGDKDAILKTKELGFYGKVISYMELRQLISS